VLFVDSRSAVEPEILSVLNGLSAKAVCGVPLGAARPGPFETFYNAIRRMVYPRYFMNNELPVEMTVSNFDSIPKGTTVFYCEKQILFDAFQDLVTQNMGKFASDDIKLLRAIVDRVPILKHPAVQITAFARKSFIASVRHLLWRGTNFVDYYFHVSMKNFWFVIVLPMLALAGLLVGLVFAPISFMIKAAAILGLNILITLLLSRSVRDVCIIFFMMPVCVAIFYCGIMRGFFFKCLSLRRP
jgi:hypothetical protein